jgi:2-oxoglutarate dehydrogenase E1 component
LVQAAIRFTGRHSKRPAAGPRRSTERSTDQKEFDPSQAKAGVETKNLVHSYRELGHFIANLDPLGHQPPETHPLLELGQFGLSLADLDKRVTHSDFQGPFDGTLRDLIAKLRATYCGTLGVEFTNISDKTQREWLIQRMEPILNRPILAPEERKALLYEFVAAQGFEDFLALKHQGQKRFGLEGGESLIPCSTRWSTTAPLSACRKSSGHGPPRPPQRAGPCLNKPYEVILGEFEGPRNNRPGRRRRRQISPRLRPGPRRTRANKKFTSP